MIRLTIEKLSGKSSAFFVLTLLFLMTFVYFYTAGAYILFFQETQSLFIFSGDYIQKFLLKPGGLVELAGEFLTQFYSNTLLGATILAASITIPGFILLKINKRLIPGNILSWLILLIPSFLMLLMQSQYYHMLEYNLGFILVFLYFLVSLIAGKYNKTYLVFLLFPFFYYLAGAYTWIYLGIYFIFKMSYGKGTDRYIPSLLMAVIAAISVVVCRKILFLEPWEQLFLYPLPFINDPTHEMIFHITVPLITFYPLICKTAEKIKFQTRVRTSLTLILIVIFFSVTGFLLSKFYNPQTARVIQLEKLVFEEKWDEAIDLHENYPSQNLIGQYFYNIALSETGQLCDRLFHGRQDFGTGSLILPWENKYLSWGGYFYYSIGMINEAHRWAYEEMVVYGFRAQNLKLLIKTNLINGNFKMAEKYISILKKTIYYKDWATKYARFISDPELIYSDPDLGKKVDILPGDNFFVQLDDPQNNLLLVLTSNPKNKSAFEYLMAWLLLSKDVETAVNNIRPMRENGYENIPTHIEEAALSYYNSTRQKPDLGGLTVRMETLGRFDQYIAAYVAARQNPASAKEVIQVRFGNTFWYYFHFK